MSLFTTNTIVFTLDVNDLMFCKDEFLRLDFIKRKVAKDYFIGFFATSCLCVGFSAVQRKSKHEQIFATLFNLWNACSTGLQLFRLHQPKADSHQRGLCVIADRGLGKNIAHISFERHLGQHKLCNNFLVAQAAPAVSKWAMTLARMNPRCAAWCQYLASRTRDNPDWR